MFIVMFNDSESHGLSYANFYPESLTYLFEFGRSPDLRLVIGLPRDISSDIEGNNKLIVYSCGNSSGLEKIRTRFPFN